MDRPSSLKSSVISGLISGSITATTLQPFEYVKTKLQQPEYSQGASGPANELARFKQQKQQTHKKTIRTIVQKTLITEPSSKLNLLNLTKFWTGLTPSLLRSAPVAAIFFGCVDLLKGSELLRDSVRGGKYQLVHSFMIGTIARTVADICTHPLGLIKTRFESDFYNYRSVYGAFRAILVSEGVLGLYKGLGATLVRDIAFSGIYLALYTKIKSTVKDNEANEASSHPAAFYASCALASSTLACALTQPPDVVRSYMQLEPNKFNSFAFTIRHIYAANGLRGFFSGFLPRSSRRILISVLSWTIYEKFSISSR